MTEDVFELPEYGDAARYRKFSPLIRRVKSFYLFGIHGVPRSFFSFSPHGGYSTQQVRAMLFIAPGLRR